MIFLVRHGESEWNAERRTQGQQPHPPLTAVGREQASGAAQAVVAELAGRPVARIVSSDLERALQTAAILAGRLDVPVEVDPRWREQALGEFEGLAYEEMLLRASSLDFTDPDLLIGGGESARQLVARTSAALADLGRNCASAVVVVSHGDAIRALFGHLAGHVPGSAPWTAVPPGSVVVLDGDDPPRAIS